MRRALALVAGALLLGWPAALNGYPLVFIDTVSYLLHTTAPELPWDKTQAYGPFLHLFHWRTTLWTALAGQVLLLSHLLWLAQRVARGAVGPASHLLLCAGLAALTSAPWFAAMLMPDAWTAALPLCLWLLAFGRERLTGPEAASVALLGAFALAAHLSHLPVALALLALVALLARQARPVLRAAVPVALALAFLLGSNLMAFGRATLSPHGSVFLLARLQADGPAAATLRERCPEAGWHLCAFTGRLPMDSDEFLWAPDSPLNLEADGSPRPMGGVRDAAEAKQILAATLADRPLGVALAMLGNAARQLGLARVGDTLGNEHLTLSARRAIAAHFPAAELAAFDMGAQMRGLLPARAAPFLLPHLPVLLAALALMPVALRRTRGRPAPRALLLVALVSLAANALATGALSKPHHRYHARIAWLLPLTAGLALAPRPAPVSAGPDRRRPG